MFVSVVLPAYKEAENLNILVPLVCKALKNYQHEVIVVDDNSMDLTEQYMNRLASEGLAVRLVIRKKNKGFANSIREGIESSSGDYILIMDSDGNHNPSYIPFMCEASKFYPCVVASRFQYGGGMPNKLRQNLSWCFNVFVRLLTGNFVTDSLFGFILIEKRLLNSLDFDKIFWGYGDYCIRLLFYLQKLNASILQFPAMNGVRVHGEGNSKFLNVFWQYFTECIKLVAKERLFRGK